MQKPEMSVVIPAYNEEKHLGTCLAALAAQQTTHSFEVIVVDNHSTDGTRAIAERFMGAMNLRVLEELQQCRGAARRTGCAAAQGTIIFSTDADVIVPPDWIEKLTMSLAMSGAGAVVGTYTIQDCGRSVNMIHNIWLRIWTLVLRGLSGQFLLRGSNFAVKRAVYEQAGGFLAYADAAEDAELGKRIQRIAPIHYDPSICVIASGRRFQRSFLYGILDYLTLFVRFFQGERKLTFSNIR